MAQNQADLIDIGALVALPIFSGFVLGVWSFQLDVFGGYDLTRILWEVGGAEVTLPLILTIAAVAWIVGTNEIGGSSYDQYELVGIGFALAVVPVYSFVPAIQGLVDSSDVAKVAVWLAIAVVATYISYTE